MTRVGCECRGVKDGSGDSSPVRAARARFITPKIGNIPAARRERAGKSSRAVHAKKRMHTPLPALTSREME
ncbi:hypothetical protein ABG768_009459 [Culter alburnus]|uniref:Uncharacterized protein n=1 Tax=Culter alburnus TaxID=194366 RepID=A0AAW1ZG99_CULAL